MLRPLTGLGTDRAVSRPLRRTDDDGFDAGACGLLQLTPEEIEMLDGRVVADRHT